MWILLITIREIEMNRRPTHPGAILREDVLPELGMSVAKLAGELQITRQHLYGILREEKSVTPNVALRLGKFIGNGPDIWLRMQDAYDLYNEKVKIERELKEIPHYGKSKHYQTVG
jgi:antitoxin HigA-1